MSTGESSVWTIPGVRSPSLLLIGVASLAAVLVAAVPPPPDASRDDDEDVAREELADLEAFFLEIAEEEGYSRAQPREKADKKIRKHGGIPSGGSHTPINEHVKVCTACRRLRTEASSAEGLWDHSWMYRKAAGDLRAHLEKRGVGKTADAARYYLGECLWGLGEEEEATRLWEKGVEASDEQEAARAGVRLADLYLARGEYEKALSRYRAGAADSVDLEERVRCRFEMGKCLLILGKGKEAKKILTALAREIPSGTKDRQREKLRISAVSFLEFPPLRGKALGATRAIAWYEQVYAEHRRVQELVRKAPVEERVALNLRRDALAEALRVNLADWDRLSHQKIPYTLKVILADARNPLVPEVARELIQIGSPDALEPVIRKIQLRQGAHRDKILDALLEEGIQIDPTILDRIIQDPKETADVRAAAARSIARRDSPQAVGILCGEIADLPGLEAGGTKGVADPWVQVRRLNEGLRDALSGMTSTEALGALGKLARSQKVSLPQREIIIDALGRTGSAEVVDPLLPLLGDPAAAIRSAAALALGRPDDPRAGEALLKGLREESEEWTFVLSLLRGLGRQGPPQEEEELLLSYAASGDHDTRVLAHALLRQTGGDGGRARLVGAVDDPDVHIRWHAIRGVGQRAPSAEIVSALITWLPQETNVRLSYQILKYLNRMTDARLGPDPEEWAKWWENAEASYDPSSRRRASRDLEEEGKKTATRYFTLEVTSKKVVFLLDTSGSMEAKITVPEGPMSTRRIKDKKINIAKRELIKVLKTFKKDTFYNVLAFADECTPLWKRLRKGSKGNTAGAIEVVQGLTAAGGTNIFDTLAQALKDRKVETIYLLSDGEPSSGSIKDPQEILKEIQVRNGAGKVKIHTIDLSGQSLFLNRLSKENGGRYVSVLYWR